MKPKINNIIIKPAYRGGIVIKAMDESGVEYIIEDSELIAYLLKAVNEKGYTTSLKPMQKYARLTINP